jgi:UDP-N-acetyl-2-amino-2-deoxyglucuronate dehydrogenase
LRSGADAICEKPLVLNPWNIDGLDDVERGTGRRISTILQLRLHPSIAALKHRIASSSKRHQVTLTYITSRGRWYHASWKGDESKSGGVATNIGVHFFDMLAHVFGRPLKSHAHLRSRERAAGFLELQSADVSWFLSVDRADIPADLRDLRSTYRSITVDGQEIEFSDGFTDLHTASYREILDGRGFGLDDVRPSIEMVSSFRGCAVTPSSGEQHQFARSHIQ